MRRMLIVLSPLLLLAGWGAPAHAQWSSYDSNRVFRCESRDNRVAHCDVDYSGGVRLNRQLSDSACIRNRTWGIDSRGIWVSSGCRGEFLIDSYADNGDFGGGYDDDDDDRYGYDNRYDDRYGDRYGNQYGYNDSFRCESRDRRTVRCSTNGRNAYIQRQLSDMPCVRGQSWGTDRYGVWVSNGCRGLFRIDRYGSGWGNGDYRGGGRWGGYGGRYGNNLVRCESRDNHSNSCFLSVGRNGSVRLLRQLSDTPCIEGQTWGRTSNGVWVTRGCRAEFVVASGGSERPPGGYNPGPLPPGVILPPPGVQPGPQPGGPVMVERQDGDSRLPPRIIDERRQSRGQGEPGEEQRDHARSPRQFAVRDPQPGPGSQPGGLQGGNPPGPSASPPPPPREREDAQQSADVAQPGHETP